MNKEMIDDASISLKKGKNKTIMYTYTQVYDMIINMFTKDKELENNKVS